jgi:hypothetical protein
MTATALARWHEPREGSASAIRGRTAAMPDAVAGLPLPAPSEMSDHVVEPFIPRQLDRDFALAVRSALALPDPTSAPLRDLVLQVVTVLRTQGATADQVLDAMEDAVAAVLAARLSGGYHAVDPTSRSPAAMLADHVRLMTSEMLLDQGLRKPKSRPTVPIS